MNRFDSVIPWELFTQVVISAHYQSCIGLFHVFQEGKEISRSLGGGTFLICCKTAIVYVFRYLARVVIA